MSGPIADGYLARHGGDRLQAAAAFARDVMAKGNESRWPTSSTTSERKPAWSLEAAIVAAGEMFVLSPTELVIVRGLAAGELRELDVDATTGGFVERLGDELQELHAAMPPWRLRLAEGAGQEQERAAVEHVLNALLRGGRSDRVERCLVNGGVDFRALLTDGTWSSGERVLLQVAACCWGKEELVRELGLPDTLGGILYVLDGSWLEAALTAIAIRRGIPR